LFEAGTELLNIICSTSNLKGLKTLKIKSCREYLDQERASHRMEKITQIGAHLTA
jgi:hypothetical protein